MHLPLNETISMEVPRIEIDGDLPVGVHRFRLVVENSAGKESAPTIHTVIIFQLVPIPQPIPIPGPTPGPIPPVGPVPAPRVDAAANPSPKPSAKSKRQRRT